MALKTLKVTGSMGAGMTIEIKSGEHTIYMDQPKNSGGADKGPAPVALILAAYAGCIGSIGRIIAFQDKIDLRGMTFECEADYDPDRILGRETTARAGFQEIRMQVSIDADLDDAAKQDFLERIEARCPILDNIENETKVVSSLKI